MQEDFFQQTKADLFQDNYFPGRVIPEYDIAKLDLAAFGTPPVVYNQRFVFDVNNRSPWITVVYNSQFEAEKASRALPKVGLRTYYPKCRKEFDEYWTSDEEQKERFVAAHGRYLFVQLPEDQESFANLEISEEFLAGPYNQNGVASIISKDGLHSLTLNDEITNNQAFHSQRNRKTDPKIVLRFRAGELVRIATGKAMGNNVQIIDNVPLSFKLKSKIEVKIGNSGAKLYVKVGSLEKL